jgi:hypothetical protein
MKYTSDEDLIARLKRVSAGPAPTVPPFLYDYVESVASGRTWPRAVALGILKPVTPRRSREVLAGVAASLMVVALAGSLLLTAVHRSGSGSSALSLSGNVKASRTAEPGRAAEEWTAIEWSDITESSDVPRFDPSRSLGSAVSWSGGLAVLATDGLYLSADGRSWSLSRTAPKMLALTSLNGSLLGFSDPGPAPSCDSDLCPVVWTSWISDDASLWRAAELPGPFLPGDYQFLADAGTAVLIGTQWEDLYSFAVSSTRDGSTWQTFHLPFPPELFDVGLERADGGFLAVITAKDNDPSQTYYWTSADGFAWTSVDPTATAVTLPIRSAGKGSRGTVGFDMNGAFLHSADGITWDHDAPSATNSPESVLPFATRSDGSRALRVAIDSLDREVLEVSLGDGRWSPLASAGALDALSSRGYVILLPNGCLYYMDGRLYFGQAWVA